MSQDEKTNDDQGAALLPADPSGQAKTEALPIRTRLLEAARPSYAHAGRFSIHSEVVFAAAVIPAAREALLIAKERYTKVLMHSGDYDDRYVVCVQEFHAHLNDLLSDLIGSGNQSAPGNSDPPRRSGAQ